jgi:hypothetical protein
MKNRNIRWSILMKNSRANYKIFSPTMVLE